MNGKTFVLALLALTVLRAAFVSFEDISPYEAYYALCARHPAPAYFDGPPGTMALAALGEVAMQAPDAIWRWWAPTWALLASLACYLLIRAVDNPVRAGWTALALNALPIFNACAVRVRPELPALAFVLLGLWCAWKALQADRGIVGKWALAGLSFALAAQFSYVVLWVLPGLMIHTLCSKKHHRGPDFLGLVLLVAIPAAGLWPAAAWNAYYEWVPVFRGTFRSLWEFSLVGFISSLARLFDKFSPILLALLFVAWVVALRGSRTSVRARFVSLCALPAVVLAVYSTLRDSNPVFFLLLASPLLIYHVLVWMPSKRFGRPILWAGFVVAIVLSVVTLRGAFESGLGWQRVAVDLKEEFLQQSNAGHQGIFLIAGDAPLASVMGYYLRNDLVPPEGHPAVYEGESQNLSSQFSLWPGYDDFIESDKVVDEYFTEQKGENPFVGRSAIYITREPADEVPQTIKAAFESVTLLRQIRPAEGEDPLYLYFCLNYQTMPL
jgi:hypothetical protein